MKTTVLFMSLVIVGLMLSNKTKADGSEMDTLSKSIATLQKFLLASLARIAALEKKLNSQGGMTARCE